MDRCHSAAGFNRPHTLLSRTVRIMTWLDSPHEIILRDLKCPFAGVLCALEDWCSKNVSQDARLSKNTKPKIFIWIIPKIVSIRIG